jgi:hypothetical protein
MDFFKIIQPILDVIVFIGCPILLYSSKTYFQSYLSETAKSNVQKRDIEELTQKVESIKAIYSKENELIKYQLNQLLALKGQHRNEERNALMKFHASYIHWIYLLQGINLSDYDRINIDQLLEKKLSLNDYFYDIQVTRANVLLIVNNEEIINCTYDMIQGLITYKSFIESNLLSLQFLLTDNKSLIEEFLKLNNNERVKMNLLEQKAQEETDIRNKIKLKQDEFSKLRTPEFLKCRYLCDDFAKKCKSYLLTID